MTRVVVYMATGCHLCPPTVAAVQAVCHERGLEATVVDIDGNVELERLHRERIPVVMVDDQEVGHYLVTESDLRVVLDMTHS
ncbi:MAG: glutaredoxin family protein [Actinobacteria bacterium]|nr:glutaredoxin family protein [Actinomycetota bacterium]